MRLIDADALTKDMVNCCSPTQFGRSTAKMCIKRAPTIEAEPVKRGKWISEDGKDTIKCLNCGFGMFMDGYFFKDGECFSANDGKFIPNFCPSCGADMREEA